MADSPEMNSDGPIRITVKSAGQVIPDTVTVMSVTTRQAIDEIPIARLVMADGDAASQEWPLADGELFKPGAEISIAAFYEGHAEQRIFSGVVVKMGISISAESGPSIIVDCQDKAASMKADHQSAVFQNQTDAAVIQGLIEKHGLVADVEATSFVLPALVQYDSSDWDFMLMRAQANGLVVTIADGKVSVRGPQPSAAATLTVTYGMDLISFDATLDATHQVAAVQTASWDPATEGRAINMQSPETPLNVQGNLNSDKLSAVFAPATIEIQTAAPMSDASRQAWADSQQARAALTRIHGQVNYQGSALAKAAGLIEMKGVGDRLNGNAFVSAIEHDIREGQWLSTAGIGLPPTSAPEKVAEERRLAAGLLPGIDGLQVGVVVQVHNDPDNEYRIQVHLPMLGEEVAPIWARLIQIQASSGFGSYFLPSVGDEVVLAFFDQNPSAPVILGSLYSSKHRPIYDLAAHNNVSAVVTASKLLFELNDDNKSITVSTPGGQQIVLDDQNATIALKDQHGNSIEMNESGISITASKDLQLKADGAISIEAATAMDLSSEADLTCRGTSIDFEAQIGFSAKGGASAELSASGETIVKGAMVMIN